MLLLYGFICFCFGVRNSSCSWCTYLIFCDWNITFITWRVLSLAILVSVWPIYFDMWHTQQQAQFIFICILLKFNIAGIRSDIGRESSSLNAGLRSPKVPSCWPFSWSRDRPGLDLFFYIRILRAMGFTPTLSCYCASKTKESIFEMKRVRGCLISVVWISFLSTAFQGRFLDPFCTI